MVRPDLPPPANAVGSFEGYLDRVRKTRRVSTLFGEKNKEGKTVVDLPGWLTRTGLVSFEIESGFGIVKCCVPGHKAQKQMEGLDEAVTAARERPATDPKREEAIAEAESKRDMGRVVFGLRLIREIPEGWVNEGDDVVEGTLRIPHGERLPEPSAVAGMSPEAQQAYLALLPPALLGQVWSGYSFVASLPPLIYDGAMVSDPS